MYVAYSSSLKPISELLNVTCRMVSHSFTCHPTQVNAPCFNPNQAGQYSTCLPWRDGRLSWRWRLVICETGGSNTMSPFVVSGSELWGLRNATWDRKSVHVKGHLIRFGGRAHKCDRQTDICHIGVLMLLVDGENTSKQSAQRTHKLVTRTTLWQISVTYLFSMPFSFRMTLISAAVGGPCNFWPFSNSASSCSIV